MTERKRSFLALLGLLYLAAGFAVRMVMHRGLTLPAFDPPRWFAIGAVEDLLVFALVILALWFVRPSIAYVAASLFVMASVALHAMQAAAAIRYGSMLFVRTATDVLPMAIALSLLPIAIAAFASKRLHPRVKKKKYIATLLISSIIVVALPLEIHRHDAAHNAAVALVRALRKPEGITIPVDKPLPPHPPMPLAMIHEVLPNDGRKPLDPNYPLAHIAPPSPVRVNVKANIVFVSLESLRAEEINAYGGLVPGVTPNFDRLAKQGIFFKRAFAAGTQTPAGELAMLYGLLPLPDRILLAYRPDTPLSGLPEVLRGHGWKSFLWMSSTDETFFYRDRFYIPRGIQYVDGNSFPLEDPRVNWGISDRALAKRAVHALGRLHEPFGALLLTVDNHHPYQLPHDAAATLQNLPPMQRFGTHRHMPGKIPFMLGKMIQTIHYTDQALGDFFHFASKQPWFERTIFVITGDHGNGMPAMRYAPRHDNPHGLAMLRHHIPLVIYSPLLEGGKVIEAPVSHIDVAPTLLSVLGIDKRAALGTNILAPIDPNRIVYGLSKHEGMVTMVTPKLMWHGITLRDGVPITSETLVDPAADPEGRNNLVDANPPELARFRRHARIVVDLHRWLVLSGRSGLPPE